MDLFNIGDEILVLVDALLGERFLVDIEHPSLVFGVPGELVAAAERVLDDVVEVEVSDESFLQK